MAVRGVPESVAILSIVGELTTEYSGVPPEGAPANTTEVVADTSTCNSRSIELFSENEGYKVERATEKQAQAAF